MKYLLNSDVLLLNQLGPTLGFTADESPEILWAATGYFGSLRLNYRTIAFLVECLIYGLVQLGDDVGRHTGRSNDSKPVGRHQINTLPFKGRHVQIGRASCRERVGQNV